MTMTFKQREYGLDRLCETMQLYNAQLSLLKRESEDLAVDAKHVTRKLRGMGWSVLRFWEKDIKSRPQWCLGRIKSKIKVKR